MPFRFTLEPLLRLRKSRERAELRRLQEAALLVVRARTQIEQLDAEVAEMREESRKALLEGCSGAELNFETLLLETCAKRRAWLVQELSRLERLRREQQARYSLARQQREILSNLREHQYSLYRTELSRREQQQSDDLFLTRQTRSRNR